MTPNGAVVFVVIIIAAAMLARVSGLVVLASLCSLFAVAEVGLRAGAALRRAVILIFPLAIFMILVWVVVVGRSPAQIAADQPGSRSAALVYVAVISARLFLIVAIVQVAAFRFAALTPLQFIRALYAPLAMKRLTVLTLSLVETLQQAIDRAYTALIASGVISRRFSLRNLLNGWILVQTVWLTAVTSVTGRMRDKWPVEKTLNLLDPLLTLERKSELGERDKIWILSGVVASCVIIWMDLHGAR
ncbi:MAG: hypothetical protein JO134_15875 [Xanthobacteraceae bacterium]|nr:hypothetical protein [Xanthobacteraceae bacterium]